MRTEVHVEIFLLRLNWRFYLNPLLLIRYVNMLNYCFVNPLLRIQKGMWWLQQDLHSADGLRFHWGGSHSNRSLLRCLGVDTGNTVSWTLNDFCGNRVRHTVNSSRDSRLILAATETTNESVCPNR